MAPPGSPIRRKTLGLYNERVGVPSNTIRRHTMAATPNNTQSQGIEEAYDGLRRLTDEVNNLQVTTETLAVDAPELTKRFKESESFAARIYSNLRGKSSRRFEAAAADSEFVNTGCKKLVEVADVFEVDMRSFDPDYFIRCLRNEILPLGNAPLRITRTGWGKFGRKNCSSLIKRVPEFEYLFGTHDFKPEDIVDPQSTQTQKKRTRIEINPSQNRPQTINNEVVQNVDMEKTVEAVGELYNHLDKLSKRNYSKPIPYLRAVVEKDSFQKTIENIFHFTFLVKNGTVELAIGQDCDGNKLTLVKLLKKFDAYSLKDSLSSSQTENTRGQKNTQVVSSFFRDDFDNFVEMLTSNPERYRLSRE